jgi:hypothetical protein
LRRTLVAFSLPPAKPVPDIPEHKFQFVEHEEVLESKDQNSVIVQEEFPLAVIQFGAFAPMDLTVQFHGEPLRGTVEVQDVITDAMLTAKLSPLQLGTLQDLPEGRFSRR